ncbi:MAG: ATP-binding protein [Syntrophales bacterium]|jgi:predicted HTH transcriptional regulator|nr:ATP-binding protein [Syntrophales bacterium]
MNRIRIFISSVQKEFAEERKILRDFLWGDPLMCRCIEVFLFEDVPAKDRRADALYLDEVEKSSIYIGLFGQKYGTPDANGLSPTHREFLRATELGKHRLIFVKGADDARQPQMKALVQEAEAQLVRRRFSTAAELISGVYASLIDYLADKEMLRFGPFDASLCAEAQFKDISAAKVKWFLTMARASRDFPLKAGTDARTVLSQLRLLKQDRPTNAAILLFGKEPQRFIYSSEVKCAHFYGTEVQKPIPSYQVYKGNLFDLVDQAVSFVLSKIDLAVGTRAHSIQAPVAYEIPPEVISEAIVNAVAHRDYTSTASVQVMLFADRLEVWNPGTLPPVLTLKSLLKPHGSYPHNPLIAEPLYLTKYIERMGTGIGDMVDRCRAAGLPAPEFKLTDGFVVTIRRKPGVALERVTSASGQATPPVSEDQVGTKSGLSRDQVEILRKCTEDRQISDLMAIAGRANRTKFRDQVLKPLIEGGLIEMTIPGKPTSSKQKYRLTAKGRALVAKLAKQGDVDGK